MACLWEVHCHIIYNIKDLEITFFSHMGTARSVMAPLSNGMACGQYRCCNDTGGAHNASLRGRIRPEAVAYWLRCECVPVETVSLKYQGTCLCLHCLLAFAEPPPEPRALYSSSALWSLLPPGRDGTESTGKGKASWFGAYKAERSRD